MSTLWVFELNEATVSAYNNILGGKMKKQNHKLAAWAEHQGVMKKYQLNDSCTIGLVIIIFKCLGLAPISVENSRSLKMKTQLFHQGLLFKQCIFGIVYIYILIIVVFSVSIVTVPLINEDSPDSDIDLLDTFEGVKGVFGLMVMFLIWLVVALQYKTGVKILNKIVDMDNEMLLLQDLYYLETSTRQISILFMTNCSVWIVIFILEILIIPDWYKIWTPLFLPSIIINWYIMQYILLLVMIENRFMSVNRGFLMISTITPADTCERKIVNNFITLRRAYAILSCICRDISDYYSFPILPTIAFICGASIYHSYYIFVPLIVVQYRQQSVLEISNTICWLLMQMLPLVVLAVCVTRVLNQMAMTGGAVYKALAQSALHDIAKDELKKFSFELLHKNVQFTAYDIFSLDCTLIQSIFGMLATYLIILMQFQLSHLQEEPHRYAAISLPEISNH